MTMSIGFVLGTLEATPLEFWVAVSPGHVLRLDDVVEVQTHRPDGEGVVRFYGVVDYVRTMYEGGNLTPTLFWSKVAVYLQTYLMLLMSKSPGLNRRNIYLPSLEIP
jgi:hypothetical protein